MTAGRNPLPEVQPREPESPATTTLHRPSEQPAPAQQVAAGTTAVPSRTPPFAQALSYRKRQFLQRDQRSRPNARGKTR